MVKHRFLLHSLSHTVLAVDVTEVGVPTEIYPNEGKQQTVPCIRFQAWRDAEQYFLHLGADPGMLQGVSNRLKSTGVAALTII